jgi:hypothetical protein
MLYNNSSFCAKALALLFGLFNNPAGGEGSIYPPSGYAFVVNNDGEYLIDNDGAYIIVGI